MRCLIQNENQSIAEALKRWKQNIDKEFAGIEECAVCYYIVHSNGQLPTF